MVARLVLALSLVLVAAPDVAYAEVPLIEALEDCAAPLVDDEAVAQLAARYAAAHRGSVRAGYTEELPPAGAAHSRVFRPPRR